MTEGVDPRDQISLRLLELVSFDVPERLVKDELARMVSAKPRQGAQSGRRQVTG